MLSFEDMTLLDITVEKALLNTCRSLLKKLPRGKLKHNTYKNNRHYYLKRPSDPKYITVKKGDKELIALARALRKRKWLETMVKVLEQNLFVENHIQQLYRAYDYSSIRKLVPDAYKFLEKTEWDRMLAKEGCSDQVIQSENPYFRENLVFCTSFGLLVRSKSEVIIAELLHAAGIPFRYEPKIMLEAPDGTYKEYYPDFVLLHPKGGNLYWEHIGKFGDEEYRRRNDAKYQAYFHNHITIGSNLIITCDNVDGVPDIQMIKEIINWLSREM